MFKNGQDGATSEKANCSDIGNYIENPDTVIGSDYTCSIDVLYDKHKCIHNKYVFSCDNNLSRQTCRHDVIGMQGSVVSLAHKHFSDTFDTHDLIVTDNDNTVQQNFGDQPTAWVC